jgi:hypothetical protein
MSLLDKLKKASTIEDVEVLSNSEFFTDKDNTVTELPILNIACSGQLDKGFTSGLTLVCGPSKHFKCCGPDTPIVVYVAD